MATICSRADVRCQTSDVTKINIRSASSPSQKWYCLPTLTTKHYYIIVHRPTTMQRFVTSTTARGGIGRYRRPISLSSPNNIAHHCTPTTCNFSTLEEPSSSTHHSTSSTSSNIIRRQRPIYVSATKQHVGKTSVSLALVAHFTKRYGVSNISEWYLICSIAVSTYLVSLILWHLSFFDDTNLINVIWKQLDNNAYAFEMNHLRKVMRANMS